MQSTNQIFKRTVSSMQSTNRIFKRTVLSMLIEYINGIVTRTNSSEEAEQKPESSSVFMRTELTYRVQSAGNYEYPHEAYIPSPVSRKP